MSDHQDEDDKPTVVLDLKALKKEADQMQNELANISSDLEFSAQPSTQADSRPENTAEQPAPVEMPKPSPEVVEQPSERKNSNKRIEVLLFDLNSHFFEQAVSKLPSDFDYSVIKTLPQLNQQLSQEGLKLIVFNYNTAPKAVNQLCAQIKSKFPRAKTIILAKNLSPEKAQAHAKSSSGANSYLSSPFKLADFKKEILKLTKDL